MARLEQLLRVPPIAITVAWLAATFEPLFNRRIRIFRDEYGTLTVAPMFSIGVLVMLISLVWLHSLHEASLARTPHDQKRPHPMVFVTTALSIIIILPLATILYYWNGDPPTLLINLAYVPLFIGAFGFFASIWAASDAMRRFELSIRASVEATRWDPLVPILFIFVGIWFIHRRIQSMLDHPRLSDWPA